MSKKLWLCRENVLSWMGFSLVIPILLASGCAYAPDILPGGASSAMKLPVLRVIAANQDIPIVITVDDGKNEVKFHWEDQGKLIWWERPGNTAAQWRFVLSVPGMLGDPLCDTKWENRDPNDTTGSHSKPCNFTVTNYLARPLKGELKYRLDGEVSTEEEAPYRSVERVYYLISNKY